MRSIIAAACALLCGTASAGVVYNWQTLDNGGATSTIAGRIEIDNSAWLTGSIDYTFNPYDWWQYGDPAVGDPNAPVIELTFHIATEPSPSCKKTTTGHAESATPTH